MKKITRPQQTNDAYYWDYINKAKGKNLLKSLKKNKKQVLKLINKLPKGKRNYAYAAGKWTTKTVLCHMIDTERIFSYRALCISRGDTASFPGYDENSYANNCNMEEVSINSLAKEFCHVRDSTISLFKHMDSQSIDTVGTASELPMTPRIIGWKIVGHTVHHAEVIKERYL